MEAASSVLGIHPPPAPKFTRAASLITRAAAPPPPPPPPPEPARSGSGFGGGGGDDGNRRRKGKERSAVVRRTPIERRPLVPEQRQEQQPQPQSGNESAFLLTWLGLGSLILVEGLALAASGFLPEEWDNFLVKYLYPSFTPTVFLFVGGTVVYGVIKYLELEKMKS